MHGQGQGSSVFWSREATGVGMDGIVMIRSGSARDCQVMDEDEIQERGWMASEIRECTHDLKKNKDLQTLQPIPTAILI